MRNLIPLLGLVLLASLAGTCPAHAASTVVLPASFCPASQAIFHDGWETVVIPQRPSHGSGGSYPGSIRRTVNVPGFGTRYYYLHVPADYTPVRAWPLLLALRGQSVPIASAAQQIRDDWSSWSDARGFIVISAVGNSTSQGGWGVSGDLEEIDADLADAAAAYNVERSRIYLWGYSSGAHLGHGIVLNHTDYFAAYGVSAGRLNAYACSDNGSFQPVCRDWLPTVQPKVPVDIHLGNSDPLYLQYGAGGDPARLQSGGWIRGQTLFYTLFTGGHIYTIEQLGQIWNNLCPFALGP